MNADELHGYMVEALLGGAHYDVSVLATSEERAISRVRLTMVHGHRNIRWLDAEYRVVETVSLEEYKAGRELGIR